MKNFLHILQRLIQYHEIAQLRPSIITPTDNDLFLLFWHQLVSVAYAAENKLDEPLRLTLLIYLNLRIWHFQSFPFMRYMVETLQKCLLKCMDYMRETAPTLFFWILFIGGMASQGHKGHPWFVSHLRFITHCLGYRDWAKVRSALGGFFYTDQPKETMAEDLWSEVIAKENCKSLLALCYLTLLIIFTNRLALI
jgi:hypothetical protein